MSAKTLVFIPTYNERENVEALYQRIKALKLNADILFLDDNSQDGTGEIVDGISKKDSAVHTVHRAGKLGIGSAHQDGIRWAYQNGYQTLVTMDCDFTHQPEDIPRFLDETRTVDVVIGSRYMDKKSLSDWNLFRKTLTYLGHFLTKHLLKIPYDASGAFRAYRLDRIPAGVFGLVRSSSYSFFFESLHILSFNGYSVHEVPILLPKRTYGHSKMRMGDALQSLRLLITTWLGTVFHRERYQYHKPLQPSAEGNKTHDEIAWDEYWNTKEHKSKVIYDIIAAFYRVIIIKPMLNYFVGKFFAPQSKVLHAGCGGGQVDTDVVKKVRVSALDISTTALNRYKTLHGSRCEVIHGSIFEIPCKDNTFDGIYNLGVMEHFTEEDIHKILIEFYRVLKPGGKIVLLWPPEHGLSVIFLKGVHFVLNGVMKKNIALHPDEITRLRSKAHAKRIVDRSGFTLMDYYFGAKDFFTYSVVVCRKGAQVPQSSLRSTAVN